MSDLIRLNPLRWPYSLARLREDEPAYSFSPSPLGFELAHFNVFRVVPQPQPGCDPSTHKIVEVEPIESDGQWLQQWEVVLLTDAEREAWYRATHPPRWLEFVAALPLEVRNLLRIAWEIDPLLKDSLSIGLGKAADGDSRVFLSAWQTARSIDLIPLSLVQGLQQLAAEHDLPPEFVAGLAGGEP